MAARPGHRADRRQGIAALELLSALAWRRIIAITRLRLDAALYDPAPFRTPGTDGRPRTKGAQLPNLFDVVRGTGTAGSAWWFQAGTGKVSATSRSARPRPCSAMAGCPSCRSAERWSVIPIVGSSRRPCCALILIGRPSRSCVGSSSAGNCRSPFRKPGLTSVSRSSCSGRISPSPAPPHACSAVLPRHLPGHAAQSLRTQCHREQRLVPQGTSGLQ
jgi:hypothetical protein